MSLSLRARFLVIVLVGGVVPLGYVGLRLARSAPASGEQLLRQRLAESLSEIVHLTGLNWVSLRSRLLTLATDSAVLAAMRTPASTTVALPESWLARNALDQIVERADFQDTTGRLIASVQQMTARTRATAVVVIPVRLVIHDPRGGERLGDLTASVRAESLIPAELLLSGVGGSVLAAFETERNTQLLPQPIDGALFSRPSFEWGGQRWVSVRFELQEPALRLALAGPAAPFTQPFQRASREGTLVLIAVTLVGLGVVAAGTRRVTRSLDSLAQASDAVARGELGRVVDESGPDEFRRVARAFNTMSANLRRTLEGSAQREALAAVGEFAASIAHEVRNPLTAIRLDLERAASKVTGNDSAADLIRRALDEIERLDGSVSGTLRLARTGRLSLGRIDFRRPTEAAIQAAQPRFRERGAKLERVDWPDTPTWVLGDGAALEQLVLNLLLNAADALDPGGRAEIAVRVDPTAIRMTVMDDGSGIPSEHLARVFEPLFSTKSGGTGLGLPVARRIAEAHGGSLSLEGQPGAGALATFTIPRVP